MSFDFSMKSSTRVT